MECPKYNLADEKLQKERLVKTINYAKKINEDKKIKQIIKSTEEISDFILSDEAVEKRDGRHRGRPSSLKSRPSVALLEGRALSRPFWLEFFNSL